MLHDTYGFPLDLTREICLEEKIQVDENAFQVELEKQRERGRANAVSAFVNFSAINPADYPATKFVGYDRMQDAGKVLDIVSVDDETLIITDQTPFYAESGGQVGDVGTISAKDAVFHVRTTEKAEHVFLHIGAWQGAARFQKGELVQLQVDVERRKATMRNHTATHLLHKALRMKLGEHVKQAGSMVAPDRLRFDFTHFHGIEPEDLESIEEVVNRKVFEALPVHVKEAAYKDAVADGAMALFGEKYGDTVRIIEVGDFSKELCGGTHLQNSAEIGLFAITGESSIAAGVRRIEAITGAVAFQKLKELRHEEKQLAQMLDRDPPSLVQKATRLVGEVKELRREIEQMRNSQARGKLDHLKSAGKNIAGVQAIIARTDDLTVDEMKTLTDELVAQASNQLVLLACSGEKAGFVLKVSKDLVQKGFHAGKMIKEIAGIAGGGGGGRPDMATAGGKDVAKIDDALAFSETLIQKTLAG